MTTDITSDALPSSPASYENMSERDIIDDLVTANHILYNEGVVDGFGHISVRHPTRPDRFLLSRSIAPGTVNAEDI